LYGILTILHEFYENCNVIDSSQVDTLLGIALILELHFIVFGWLSDKLGRKYIMMGGMLLAILLTDQFTNKCLKQRM
jgi:MFS family permease